MNKLFLRLGLIVLIAGLAGCSNSNGVKIKSTKFVDHLAADGVGYTFQGQDILKITLNFYFEHDLAPALETNSEKHRAELYKQIMTGVHFHAQNAEIKNFYGYWPETSDKKCAKNMTLFYVIPKDRLADRLVFSFDGTAIGLPDYKFSHTIPDHNISSDIKRSVKDYTFNGSKFPVSVRPDKDAPLLVNKREEFKDDQGREVVVLGFKEETSPPAVYANVKLLKGQTTTFTVEKCRKGMIGKNAMNGIPTENRQSNGDLALAQNGSKITFTVLEGFAVIGVSFDADKGVKGNLEGNMDFEYFTAGTKVLTKTDISVAD